jgi:hypothetical protein
MAVSESTKGVFLAELSSAICLALKTSTSPATAAGSRKLISGQGFERLDMLITSLQASSADEAGPGAHGGILDTLARPAISSLLESENRESIPEAAVLLASLIKKFGNAAQKGQLPLALFSEMGALSLIGRAIRGGGGKGGGGGG